MKDLLVSILVNEYLSGRGELATVPLVAIGYATS